MCVENKMPFLFRRYRRITPENQLSPNYSPTAHCVFIVILAKCWDEKFYNARWMNDEIMGQGNTDDDYVTVPDVDLEEAQYVYDGPDGEQNYRNALHKMKGLWAEMEI